MQQTATPIPQPNAVFTVQSPFAIATQQGATTHPEQPGIGMALGTPTTFAGQVFSQSEG